MTVYILIPSPDWAGSTQSGVGEQRVGAKATMDGDSESKHGQVYIEVWPKEAPHPCKARQVRWKKDDP